MGNVITWLSRNIVYIKLPFMLIKQVGSSCSNVLNRILETEGHSKDQNYRIFCQAQQRVSDLAFSLQTHAQLRSQKTQTGASDYTSGKGLISAQRYAYNMAW